MNPFEKILDRFETLENIFIKGNSHNVAAGVSKAKEIVHEVAEEYNNGWIPCSERLPDKAGYEVLATLENSFGQRRVTIIFTGYGDESFWHYNNKEYDLEAWKVIAWQPLPELYKEND